MTFEKVDLGNVCTFFNNSRKPVTRSSRVAGEYRYFGAAGIQDYVSEYLFDGDFILVGEDGTVITDEDRPVVQQVSGKFWVNNHAHVIQPNDMQDYDYLYYAISSTKVRDLITGAVQPKLSMTNLKQLQVPWATDSEVRLTIGSILRNLDDKIASNNALSRTLEEIAQTIFKSWFIDFDPVKAKIAGEKPAGMDDETASLFPDSLLESHKGLVPKSWSFMPIGTVSDLMLGGTPSREKKEYWRGGIPWINSGKIHEFRIFEPSEYISEEGLSKSSTKMLPSGTTVIGITGYIWYSRVEIDVCGNQSTIGLIPKGNMTNEFLFLNIKNNIKSIIDLQTGTAQQHVNRGDISNFEILIPDDKILIKFGEKVSPIFSMIASLGKEAIHLRTIRDSFLPRLISGELRIPEELLTDE